MRWVRPCVVASPLVAVTLWIAACTHREVVGVEVAVLEVSPPTAAVQAGDTLRLVAVVRDDRGKGLSGVDATWISSEPTIVSISSDGLARGLRAGVADVTATLRGKSATARVAVTPPPSFAFQVMEHGAGTVVTEAGGTDSVSVSLLARPQSDVVLLVASADTGEVKVAPPILTFTPSDWNVEQRVTLTGVDDPVADGAQVTNVTLSVDAARSDSAFAAAPSVSIAVVTQDGEAASVAVTHTGGSTVATEGGAGDSITVSIGSRPASNVTMTVVVDDPADMTVEPATLTFTPAGAVSQRVRVQAVDDSALDGNRTRSIVVSVNPGSDPFFLGVTSQPLQAITVDNDGAGYTVSETSGRTVVAESGSTDIVTVVLDAQPSRDVVFRVTSTDLTEVTVSPERLVFTPAAWSQPQSVTVVGVDDSAGDGDQRVPIRVTVDPASDPAFAGLSRTTVTATNVDNDAIGFTVSETDGTVVNEAGTVSDAVAVRLNTVPTGNVVLRVSRSDDGEISISPQTLTFTPANAGVAQPVAVTGMNDQVVDGDVMSDLTLSVNRTLTLDAAYDTVSNRVVGVTTLDDDVPDIVIVESGGSTSVEENGTTDAFTIALSHQPLSDVVLRITSTDATEVDADPTSLRFTSSNWSTPRSVTVTGVDDGVPDGDDVTPVVVSVNDGSSNSRWRSVADRAVQVTTREVTASFTVTESGGATSVSESGTTDAFTVVLGSRPSSTVTMTVVADDPSEARVDSATLTFTPAGWDRPKTVTVRGIDDSAADGPRQSTITISVSAGSPASYVALPPRVVNVTTTDDETAGFSVTETAGSTIVNEGALTDTITVVLTARPQSDVVLAVSSADDGEVVVDPTQLTFTPEAWNTSRRVILKGVQDGVQDGADNTAVTISVVDASSDNAWDPLPSQVVSVTTQDVTAGFSVMESSGGTTVDESGTTDAFTVVLSSAPASNVVFTVTSTDDGEAVTDSSTLTFTPSSWNVAKTVRVRGVDDLTIDGTQSSTVWVAVAGGSDPAFVGLSARSVTVTTTDDDVAGFEVSESGGDTSVNEGGGRDSFTIVLLARPLSNVVLQLSSSAPGEVDLDSATVTFTPASWSTAKTVTARGVDDDVTDGDQTATVTISVAAGSNPAYSEVDAQTVSVVNEDDEVADFEITETQDETEVDESGSTDSFEVVLTSRPTSSVTLTISNPDTTELSLSVTSVTFMPNEWDVPQTVTVTGADDEDADGPQITQLVVAVDDAASNDQFDAAASQTVTVTTRDDEL